MTLVFRPIHITKVLEVNGFHFVNKNGGIANAKKIGVWSIFEQASLTMEDLLRKIHIPPIPSWK